MRICISCVLARLYDLFMKCWTVKVCLWWWFLRSKYARQKYQQQHHDHESVLPKVGSFTASAGSKPAVLPKAGLSPQTQEPRLQFYQEWIVAVASRCFPYHTLSFSSEQTLKVLKRSQVHQVKTRRVDLANCVLRTSPKFTTREISVPSKFLTTSEIRKSQSPFAPRKKYCI